MPSGLFTRSSFRKILAVARHEFIGTVTRLGYILTLIGMPAFIGGIGLISGLSTARLAAEQISKTRVIGIVDETGLFASAPLVLEPQDLPRTRDARRPPLGQNAPGGLDVPVPAMRAIFKRFPSMEEARAALLGDEVSVVVRLPKTYLEDGKAEEYKKPRRNVSLAPELEGTGRVLRPWLIRGLAAGRVDDAIAKRLAAPVRLEEFSVEADGTVAPHDLVRELKTFVVPLGFSLLLLLSIFTSASYLATSLAEEKANRALELLLTSLTPEQLFWGKLVGIWLAALLQFLLYLGLAAVPAAIAFAALDLQISQAVIAFLYFILGFFFFGAVLLAVGSIGNTQKYTQQIAGMFTFTGILPFMMVGPILSNPTGGLARALTFIPFTAPITAMLRSGVGALPAWETAASLAVLLVSSYLVIRASAKVFRVALLATGTTPSVGQIWTWLRE